MRYCESFSASMLREITVTDHAKGTAMVLGPEEGESFWQPLPSTGYVINKSNPYNSPYDAFSTGLLRSLSLYFMMDQCLASI